MIWMSNKQQIQAASEAQNGYWC